MNEQSFSKNAGALLRLLCACLLAFPVLGVAQASTPAIGTVTSNVGSGAVGRYQKLELSFPITTQATNPYLPYDPSVPSYAANLKPKEDATRGVSVDGLFLPPGQTDWSRALVHPCFLYRDFTLTPDIDIAHQKVLGLVQDAPDLWKCRFAPQVMGAWQYKIRVTDAGGTAYSGVGTFTCAASNSKGFLRVASKDRRYFQFDEQAGTDEAANLIGYNSFGGLADLKYNIDAIAATGATSIIRLWIGSRSGLEICGGWSNSNSGRSLSYYGTNSGLVVPGRNSRYCFNMPGDGNLDSAELSLKPNVNYTLSLWIKASAASSLRISTQDSYTYRNRADHTVAVPASGWTHYTIPWAGHDPRAGLNYRGQFIILGQHGPDVQIDDVQVLDPDGHDVFEVGDFERHVQYNQRQSWELDAIVDEAEAKGQYLRLNCLDNDDDMFTDVPQNGGAPSQYHNKDYFFGQNYAPDADIPVRRWQRYYARYLQARWGYSTAVAQFEYNNEGTYSSPNHLAAAKNFAHAIHSYTAHGRRLASTSVYQPGGLSGKPFDTLMFRDSSNTDLDYADMHVYPADPNTATPYDPITKGWGPLPGGKRGLGCTGSAGADAAYYFPNYIRGQGTWHFSISIQADKHVHMNWFGRGPFVGFQLHDLNGVHDNNVMFNIPDGKAAPPLTGQGLSWTTYTGTFEVPDGLEHHLDMAFFAQNQDGTPIGGTVRYQDMVLTAPDGRIWAKPTFDEPSMNGDTASQVMYTAQPYVSLSGDPDLGMPLTVGETDLVDWKQNGYDTRIQKDTAGVYMRQFCWAHMNPSAAILFLYTNAGYDAVKNGWWKYAAAYQKFLAGVPLANGRYRNIEAQTSTPEIIVTGQRDVQAGRAHFFVYNRDGNWLNLTTKPGSVKPVSGTVTVPGLPDGAYTVEQWDTSLGAVRAKTQLNSVGGVLIVPIDRLASDEAFKIYPFGASPSLTTSLSVDKAVAKPGDVVNYTLTYANTGTADALNVALPVPVPAHTHYVASSTGGVYDAAKRVVNWKLGTVTPGAQGKLTVTVGVDK